MTKGVLGKQPTRLREAVNVKLTNAPINTMAVVNSASSTTITATQLLSGHVFRTGFTGDITDTLGSSAAEIVNAIPNCQVGDQFNTLIYTHPSTPVTSGTLTHSLVTGTNISNRANIANVQYTSTLGAHFLTYKFVVTNVTTPTVVLHRLSSVTATDGGY